MPRLKEIKDKNTWNNFILNSDIEFYSFLSSWEWWEFKKENWNHVFRYWIYKGDTLIWLICLLKIEAKRGNYLFAPHNPLILQGKEFFNILENILKELRKLAKEQNCNFIRFNSTVKNNKENKKKYERLWFINAPMHEHAEDTHLLDLWEAEEKLLLNMHKKDRYYINRARKEWVEVRIDNKNDHIQTLIKMHHEHAKKVWYHQFSEKYIMDLYNFFWDSISTISTSYNWVVESILMTIKFWKTCVYYVAASDIVSHKFSPNYLCQWEAIWKAKKDWCSTYNFWWVSPDNNPKHPIAWVTKFKRKFAWYDYSLLHAQDLIISPKYWFNWIIETIRRKKRGYYYKKPE